MCQGDFIQNMEEEACEFLEELSEKIMQQESFNDKHAPGNLTCKNDIHSVKTSIFVEALEIKGLFSIKLINYLHSATITTSTKSCIGETSLTMKTNNIRPYQLNIAF